jgi:Sugar (and other) transporter
VDASLGAAALFLLPESPRWLVVNGRLDEALSVIQHILSGSTLPSGAHPAAPTRWASL